jgi:hypothetical protein
MQALNCDCGKAIAEVLPMIQSVIDRARADCYVRDNKRLTAEQVFTMAEFADNETIEVLVAVCCRLGTAVPAPTPGEVADVPL